MIYNKTCQDWVDFEKSVGSLRKDLDREALEGILGSLRWHKNLWFNLLTSSTLLYVRLTFLHNQTRWSFLYVCCSASRELQGYMDWSIQWNPSSRLVATCFILVLFVWSHTKDDMLYSRWTCPGLWCRHVLPHMCIPHVQYARQGYTPFKQRVSEVERCPCSGLTHGYCFYSER
jgi:hypothetical protein